MFTRIIPRAVYVSPSSSASYISSSVNRGLSDGLGSIRDILIPPVLPS